MGNGPFGNGAHPAPEDNQKKTEIILCLPCRNRLTEMRENSIILRYIKMTAARLRVNMCILQ